MVTGDRADTGSAIGEKVGLDTDEKTFLGRDLGEPEEVSEQQTKTGSKASMFLRG